MSLELQSTMSNYSYICEPHIGFIPATEVAVRCWNKLSPDDLKEPLEFSKADFYIFPLVPIQRAIINWGHNYKHFLLSV